MLGSSLTPLCDAYDVALLDLDGVLYLDAHPVAHAAESVASARAAGMRLAFVTNNASRAASTVAEHLCSLGVAADAADVVTSGQAAARALAARLPAGSRVLVVGSEALAAMVQAQGLAPVRTAEGAVAVVQGFSDQTGWSDLAEAAVALRAGALWIAGNTDATYPSPRGPLPGNGALVEALRITTGREPVVVGKPEPVLLTESVQRMQARRPLVVGDRLDTDVLGARRIGVDSLLVLTGVTSRTELLAAPESLRPTYVAHDLRALMREQLPVVPDDGSMRCGGARAWWSGGQVQSEGSADEALRAACALAWQA